MNLQETIKRILREGLDDKWTSDDNQTVTLKELLDIVKDIPITKMSTKKLIKRALHADNPDEQKNIEKADLKYPVLILVNDDESIKFIVDGHHRIQKASKHKLPTVNAKLIKFSELPKKFREVLGGEKEEETERMVKEDSNKNNTWKEINGKLIKKYKFSDYDEVIDFVNKVANIAKKQDHHPDMKFGYDNVIISIFDHEQNKISEKCHKFANAVEQISSDKPKKEEQKEEELKERCWAGYTQKGMKTMFGKRYPNCVKKKK